MVYSTRKCFPKYPESFPGSFLPTMWETWVQSLGWEDLLEKGKPTHSSILVWRIPWTEEPGGLQSMGCKNWTRLSDHTHQKVIYKEKNQTFPSPFLPSLLPLLFPMLIKCLLCAGHHGTHLEGSTGHEKCSGCTHGAHSHVGGINPEQVI